MTTEPVGNNEQPYTPLQTILKTEIDKLDAVIAKQSSLLKMAIEHFEMIKERLANEKYSEFKIRVEGGMMAVRAINEIKQAIQEGRE